MLESFHAVSFRWDLWIFVCGCVVLDAFFGDPADWPHPVRLLGRGFVRLEPWARECRLGPVPGGGGAVFFLVVLCAGSVGVLTSIPVVGELMSVYFGYAGLALGCLFREAAAVSSLLATGNLGAARTQLAGLVSRDTTLLDRDEACRALGETFSENFNDGFVAPLFWLCLGGPVVLWAYKVVSTADSMWGYRTARFERLGKVAARMDDLLAWVPARIAAMSIWVAGWLLLCPASWSAIARDARRMDSPNAGWPMSAAAHVVRAGMGGPTSYFGQVKDKPLLGPAGNPWTEAKVCVLRRVLILAAVLCTVVLGWVAGLLGGWNPG